MTKSAKPLKDGAKARGSNFDTPLTSDESGSFGRHWGEVFGAGLVPIPIELDGKQKRPCIKGFQQRRFTRPSLERLAERFVSAELGIATGPQSGVLVVDVDTDENGECPDLEAVVEEFGEAVILVRTPSGGLHLYYRWTDERSANWRKPFGMKVDIKALGSYVAFPPSRRSDGRGYEFVKGGLSDFANLTPPRPSSKLKRIAGSKIADSAIMPPSSSQSAAAGDARAEAIEIGPDVGYRQDQCFYAAHVECCAIERSWINNGLLKTPALLAEAEARVAAKVLELACAFDPPLDDKTAIKAASKPLEYLTKGTLEHPGCPPYSKASMEFIDDLALRDPGLFGFLFYLKVHNERKAGPFVVAIKAIAKAHSVSVNTIKKRLSDATSANYLIETGTAPNGAAEFEWNPDRLEFMNGHRLPAELRPTRVGGSKIDTNTIKYPALASPPAAPDGEGLSVKDDAAGEPSENNPETGQQRRAAEILAELRSEDFPRFTAYTIRERIARGELQPKKAQVEPRKLAAITAADLPKVIQEVRAKAAVANDDRPGSAAPTPAPSFHLAPRRRSLMIAERAWIMERRKLDPELWPRRVLGNATPDEIRRIIETDGYRPMGLEYDYPAITVPPPVLDGDPDDENLDAASRVLALYRLQETHNALEAEAYRYIYHRPRPHWSLKDRVDEILLDLEAEQFRAMREAHEQRCREALAGHDPDSEEGRRAALESMLKRSKSPDAVGRVIHRAHTAESAVRARDRRRGKESERCSTG